MSGILNGKVAIITGAGSGIGRALAVELSKQHCHLALSDVNEKGLAETAVAAGAKVVWPVADQSYRWRVGRVVDPFGHHWEIGKPLTEPRA